MGKDFDPRGDSRLVGGLVPSRSSGVISREGGLLRRFGKAVSVCGVCHSARAPARGGGVFSAAAPCAGRALSVAASCGERVPAASCGAFASRGVSMRARHGAGPDRAGRRESWQRGVWDMYPKRSLHCEEMRTTNQ